MNWLTNIVFRTGHHGGFGAEGHDTGKTDLSGQGTAGEIGENMKEIIKHFNDGTTTVVSKLEKDFMVNLMKLKIGV